MRHLSISIVRCFPVIIRAAESSFRRSRTSSIIYVRIPARSHMSAPSKGATKPTRKSQISRNTSISMMATRCSWNVPHAKRESLESTFSIIRESARLWSRMMAAVLEQKVYYLIVQLKNDTTYKIWCRRVMTNQQPAESAFSDYSNS